MCFSKISAVSLALTKSEEARIEKLGNFFAAISACSFPKSVRGGLLFLATYPWHSTQIAHVALEVILS